MLDPLPPGPFRDVPVPSGARIRTWTSGSGDPVLLLHGWPQTSAMWHAVAPGLAEEHTVVLADLPSYGASLLPQGAGVAASSKRAMAADLVAAMTALGHHEFAVVGHDRGARCAYRMALDHPQRVTALAALDILPTLDAVERVDAVFARSAWHWFLLAQPADLPERIVAADPDGVLGRGLAQVCTPEALAQYRAAWARPEVVHGMCQDYRAALDIDVDVDRADRGTARSAARRWCCGAPAVRSGGPPTSSTCGDGGHRRWRGRRCRAATSSPRSSRRRCWRPCAGSWADPRADSAAPIRGSCRRAPSRRRCSRPARSRCRARAGSARAWRRA